VKRRRHPWTYNDSHVHRLPQAWVARADMELVRLARGAAGLRLAIGEGLAVLRRRALDLELGFSSCGAYALERLGQRPRWADDTRRVAERLEALPLLRDAVRSGDLGWSMAELLARHATPETEAELLHEARKLTFRALRDRLDGRDDDAGTQGGGEGGGGEGGGGPDPGGDPPTKRTERLDIDEEDLPPRRPLSLTVDREVAWALEGTRAVVAALSGDRSTEHFVEALLAEGIVTLQNLRPHLRVSSELDDEDRAHADAWRAQVDSWRKEAERDREERIPEYTRADIDPDALGDLWRDIESLDLAHMPPDDLDQHLRGLAQQLAGRDLELGELALDFMAQDGWRRLSYASLWQYLRERLRISHATLKAHMTLARRAITLPEVAAALEAGVIGFEAARLVSRVAERRTVQAWLERATRRTVKHLREEVEAVESIARANGERQRGPEPPDEETMETYLELQRAMLDGRVAHAIANGRPCDDALRSQLSVDHKDEDQHGGQMSVGRQDEDQHGGQMSVGHQDEDQHGGQMSVDGHDSGHMSGDQDQHGGQMSVDGHDSGHMPGDQDQYGGQMSADGLDWGHMAGDQDQDGGQMSVGSRPARPARDEELRPGAGRVTVRLLLPDDLIRYWRTVEAMFRRSYLPGTFVDFLIRSFWHTWLLEDPTQKVAYQHIYQRDRYRCTSPVCSRTDVTPHHIVFRSRGGGEEDDNLTSLCVICHLEVLHGGRMTAEPPASRVRWTIGRLDRSGGGREEERRGLITVIGREKVA